MSLPFSFEGSLSEKQLNRVLSYSDRFIPARSDGLVSTFDLLSSDKLNKEPSTYVSALRNEILSSECSPQSSPEKNLLRYRTRKRHTDASPYSFTPLSPETQRLLSSPRKCPRKISRVPFKILEAPSIQDDFYLNLVDWSSQNVLAVGLCNFVYIWNAVTSDVTQLCSVGFNDSVTSVNWINRGSHIAIGTFTGTVQIWDVAKSKKIRDLRGHQARVGALAWNSQCLSSGSRDHTILHRDVRSGSNYELKMTGHTQEVCGLKWSSDGKQLASGGNDNRLLVWDAGSAVPTSTFSDHTAAVKAISWSPHQRGLLVSGGGTADRCLRFWNTLTSTAISSLDTGSQICNLAWSKTSNELVSTHGYSQNQVIVWSYPSLNKLATLNGHTMRVLYLSMSPDGQTIVTGAGDETLRFWNVFPSSKEGQQIENISTSLFHRTQIR